MAHRNRLLVDSSALLPSQTQMFVPIPTFSLLLGSTAGPPWKSLRRSRSYLTLRIVPASFDLTGLRYPTRESSPSAWELHTANHGTPDSHSSCVWLLGSAGPVGLQHLGALLRIRKSTGTESSRRTVGKSNSEMERDGAALERRSLYDHCS